MIENYEQLAQKITETYFMTFSEQQKQALHNSSDMIKDSEMFAQRYLKVYSVALKHVSELNELETKRNNTISF